MTRLVRSHRTRAAALAVTGAAALAVALLPGPAAAARADTALTATVGPGFTISLVDGSGARVTRLDPGTYTIQVHDLSEAHNAHLSGPGVDKLTEVETTGDATWTVTLAAGSYRLVCDPHASVMKQEIAVGAATTPAASTAASTTTAAPAAKPAAASKAAASKAAAAKVAAAKKAAAAKAAAAKAAAKKAAAAKAKAAAARPRAATTTASSGGDMGSSGGDSAYGY